MKPAIHEALSSAGRPLRSSKLATVDTGLRYERWFLALSVPLGFGPRHSDVRIKGAILHVRMGWGFTADIPLGSIASARPSNRPVTGWGVHGFGGDWLVNGSSKGIVELTIDPMSVGYPGEARRNG